MFNLDFRTRYSNKVQLFSFTNQDGYFLDSFNLENSGIEHILIIYQINHHFSSIVDYLVLSFLIFNLAFSFFDLFHLSKTSLYLFFFLSPLFIFYHSSLT
jgi:hypothetical protein